MKNRTLIAVEQQIAAMGCEVYEIGLFKPHTPDSDPREPEMLPRTWDRATLIKSVPWLRYQNSQGRNIYIRPKGEHHLSMVDDVTADAIKRMKAFQAWLNHGQILPQRLSTLAARLLAEKFCGDKGAADWRHFGRLAGFTNRKNKYQAPNGSFPFVRVREGYSLHSYSAAGDLLSRITHELRSDSTPVFTGKEPTPDRRVLTIDAFRARSKYCGDGHRIDLAYAVYAVTQGISEVAIADAIESRDLSKKGSPDRQRAYTTRTIAKALNHVGRVGGR
jgi:hypothetical protein